MGVGNEEFDQFTQAVNFSIYYLHWIPFAVCLNGVHVNVPNLKNGTFIHDNGKNIKKIHPDCQQSKLNSHYIDTITQNNNFPNVIVGLGEFDKEVHKKLTHFKHD